MNVRPTAVLIGLVLLASACTTEQSESEPPSTDAVSSETTAVAAAADVGNEATTEDTASSEDAAAPAEDTDPSAGGDGATATVSLENGETFTFDILCNLEPQIAAGLQILFTVVSYDDPVNLDVTQLGDDSVDVDEIIADMLAGAASISLYDSTTYDTLWEANTLYGNAVELEIDGNTVTGRGVFLEDGELGSPEVPGELIATC